MSDLENFAEWDPGVTSAKQVAGDSPGRGAAYDVSVKGVVGDMTLQYRINEFDSPERLVARAESRLLTSVDTVIVRPDGSGSVVTYDADLTFNGPLGLADPLLGLAFDRIGDRAAEGLVRVLDGTRVAE